MFAIAAAFVMLPVAGAAQDVVRTENPQMPSENRALAQQIIDRGYPRDLREDLFFASMDQMLAQTREATLKAYDLDDAGAVAILDRWTLDYVSDAKAVLRSHIPSLMDAMAASYAATFTTQELRDILAFVSTPSGQRFFELSPAILAEPNFAAANQAYMNEVQAQLPAAMEDLIERLRAYQAGQDAAGTRS